MFSVATNVPLRSLSNMPAPSPRFFELGVLFGRVERFEAHRNRRLSRWVSAAATRLDAQLLRDGAAFEAAWAQEINALIAMKRAPGAQTESAAWAARAATEEFAARIEEARASTLDGLKVKARALLWRRHGEPLAADAPHRRFPHAVDA